MTRAALWELFRDFYRNYRNEGVPALVAFGQAKWDFSRVFPAGYGVLFGGRK
jgi:hypothetical protein